MKKYLLLFLTLGMVTSLTFAQTEVLINDFEQSFSTDPAGPAPKIYGDDYATYGDNGPNTATVTFPGDGTVKSEYNWQFPSWYPRTIWYYFADTLDLTTTPVLEVKYKLVDQDSDSILTRFDLFGYGAEPLNDTIRENMETNGNPWEFKTAVTNEWETVQDNFEANNRFFCTYWFPYEGIAPTRVDSTRIIGFQAFTGHADDNTALRPGTLWIDHIKVKDMVTGIEKVVFGRETAFSLILYPTPALNTLNFDSENAIAGIELVDLTGRVVRSTQGVLNIRETSMDIAGLAKGIYIARVADMKGNTVTKKFIKK